MTQFASMEGLKEFDEKLKESGIDGYLANYRGEIYLSLVFDYLEHKKIFPESEGRTRGLFLDKISRKQFEKLKTEYADLYKKRINNDATIKLFYPTGWDSGINIFNQTSDYTVFQKNVVETINKAKNLYKDIDFNKAIERALNEDTEKEIKKSGLKNVIFISRENNKKAISLDDIKNNLNFKIPNEKEIENIITSLANVLAKEEEIFIGQEELIKKTLLKYFYNEVTLYSPKKMAIKMKELKQNIEKALPEGKTMEDVYYIIPQKQKSYTFVSRMYADVNKIEPDRFISNSIATLEKSEKEKVYVLLDDISATGSSILSSDGLEYKHLKEICKRGENLEGKNTYIIAPILITEIAKKAIGDEISLSVRKNPNGQFIEDKLVITDKISRGKDKIRMTEDEAAMLDLILEELSGEWGSKGYMGSDTGAIFPYMTPDNNSPVFEFLAYKMLVSKDCIKNKPDAWLEEEVFKEIEQNENTKRR